MAAMVAVEQSKPGLESTLLPADMVVAEPLATDKTLLPSGAIAAHAAAPSHFGVARSEEHGRAIQGLLYEHHYEPQPVRTFSQEKPPDSECGAVLWPAVRNRKAPFRFFGLRVPGTADHARCWLGRVLLEELRLGRLQHVELVLPPEQKAPAREKPVPLKAHDQQPSWKWSVWVAGASLSYTARDPPVQVQMHCSLEDGIYIDLQSERSRERCFLFRVLRQYCDDDCQGWHPIPDEQKGLSKVLPRGAAKEDLHKRVIGEARSAGIDDSSARFVADLKQAELWIVQALSRVEATREVATLKDAMIYSLELRKALRHAQDVRFKLRPCYAVSSSEALELLAQKALKEGQDRNELAEVRDIVQEICGYGVPEPQSYGKVLEMLRT